MYAHTHTNTIIIAALMDEEYGYTCINSFFYQTFICAFVYTNDDSKKYFIILL